MTLDSILTMLSVLIAAIITAAGTIIAAVIEKKSSEPVQPRLKIYLPNGVKAHRENRVKRILNIKSIVIIIFAVGILSVIVRGILINRFINYLVSRTPPPTLTAPITKVSLAQATITLTPSVASAVPSIQSGISTLPETPVITLTELNPVRYDYTVVNGDALDRISKKYLITDLYADAIGRANCNPKPVEGNVLIIRYYYIQKGDTLDLIAEKFGGTAKFLRSINNLSEDVVSPPVGQILILPGNCRKK